MSSAATMAIAFYYADCKKTFNSWTAEGLKELAKEISQISHIVPIQVPSNSFKKGEIVKLIQNIKTNHIKANNDNTFEVVGVAAKSFTTVHLLALLNYCVNSITDGQLSKKFPHVRIGEML